MVPWPASEAVHKCLLQACVESALSVLQPNTYTALPGPGQGATKKDVIMPTKIEWANESWNPVTGCSPVSEGCANCYAKAMAQRLRGRYGYPRDDPFAVTLHPERLAIPLHWKKPRMVFVCSMGDLFHPKVPWDFIQRVFTVAALAPQHTYMLLTKRPGRMCYFAREYRAHGWPPNVWAGVSGLHCGRKVAQGRTPNP